MPAVFAHAPIVTTTSARSRRRSTVSFASCVVTAPSITATSMRSGMGSLEVSCQ